MVSVIQTASCRQQQSVFLKCSCSDSETCDVRMDVSVLFLAEGKNISKSALTSVRVFFANGARTFQNTLFADSSALSTAISSKSLLAKHRQRER